MDRHEREALQKSLSIIDTIVNELDLEAQIQTRATELFRKTMDSDEFDTTGRSYKTIVAACITIAIRESGATISTEDVASVIDKNEKAIHRTRKKITESTDIDLIIANPHDYVDDIGNQLDASSEYIEAVHEFVDIVIDNGAASGRKASVIAGSCFYLRGCLHGGNGSYTQQNISDAADCTTVSIRNSYREFARTLDGKHELTQSLPIS
jgi:transcription initiation factor TFIIIB Brf1 subunit/transcription initiation factor TFIIB